MKFFNKVGELYLFNDTRHPIVDVVLQLQATQQDVVSFGMELGILPEALIEAVQFLASNPHLIFEHRKYTESIH